MDYGGYLCRVCSACAREAQSGEGTWSSIPVLQENSKKLYKKEEHSKSEVHLVALADSKQV